MAGRMLTYIMLIFMISGLLYVAGITSDNENNTIKIITQLTSNNGQIEKTDLYIKIVAAIVIITGAAAVTAFVFGNASSSIVIGSAALSTLLVSFVTDFIFVINKAASAGQDWVYWVLWIVFTPIIFGFAWSIFDFIRGVE